MKLEKGYGDKKAVAYAAAFFWKLENITKLE